MILTVICFFAGADAMTAFGVEMGDVAVAVAAVVVVVFIVCGTSLEVQTKLQSGQILWR